MQSLTIGNNYGYGDTNNVASAKEVVINYFAYTKLMRVWYYLLLTENHLETSREEARELIRAARKQFFDAMDYSIYHEMDDFIRDEARHRYGSESFLEISEKIA